MKYYIGNIAHPTHETMSYAVWRFLIVASAVLFN